MCRGGFLISRQFVVPAILALFLLEIAMRYFVTGATGFIGKRLVLKLLERKGSVVYFLIRKTARARSKPCVNSGAPALRVSSRCRVT